MGLLYLITGKQLCTWSRLRLKCDGTRTANIRLVISAKRLITSDAVRFEFLKAMITKIAVEMCNILFKIITSLMLLAR